MAEYKDIDEILKKLPDDLPYKASVKRVLIQAPAADVVQRVELDAMRTAANSYKMHYENAKSEVARVIFDSIERLLFAYRKMSMSGPYYVADLRDAICELKKKYMGGTK